MSMNISWRAAFLFLPHLLILSLICCCIFLPTKGIHDHGKRNHDATALKTAVPAPGARREREKRSAAASRHNRFSHTSLTHHPLPSSSSSLSLFSLPAIIQFKNKTRKGKPSSPSHDDEHRCRPLYLLMQTFCYPETAMQRKNKNARSQRKEEKNTLQDMKGEKPLFSPETPFLPQTRKLNLRIEGERMSEGSRACIEPAVSCVDGQSLTLRDGRPEKTRKLPVSLTHHSLTARLLQARDWTSMWET